MKDTHQSLKLLFKFDMIQLEIESSPLQFLYIVML